MAISFFDKFCDQPIKVLHYKKPKPMAVANTVTQWKIQLKLPKLNNPQLNSCTAFVTNCKSKCNIKTCATFGLFLFLFYHDYKSFEEIRMVD